MKIYAIRNDNYSEVASYLIYSKAEKQFAIEITQDADEWKTPLLIASFLKRNITTIDPFHSKEWVKQRIVPTDRQNLGQILRNNGLKTYDEYELLILGNGRCAQDDHYIDEIGFGELPSDIQERMNKRIKGAVPLGNGQYLVCFLDGCIKKCNIYEISRDNECLEGVFRMYPSEMDNARPLTDGYGFGWGDDMCILYPSLYSKGTDLPINYSELTSAIKNSLVSSAEAGDILDCSRQYINELVRKGRLKPIKFSGKNPLFLKSDVINIRYTQKS